jgi:hypothetical protein
MLFVKWFLITARTLILSRAMLLDYVQAIDTELSHTADLVPKWMSATSGTALRCHLTSQLQPHPCPVPKYAHVSASIFKAPNLRDAAATSLENTVNSASARQMGIATHR